MVLKKHLLVGAPVIGLCALSACESSTNNTAQVNDPLPVENSSAKALTETTKRKVPADKFDLSQWKITVPLDENQDGKIDEIKVADLQSYQHDDFFYLNENGHMVFATPNKAITTANSTNTRSELRHMLGGAKAKTKAPTNNFAVNSHKNADKFAQIGGNLQATVSVNHVATRASYPEKHPAFSVVVGQIHATKDKQLVAEGEGFGYGNEPLKIYYKKWPTHKYGSVFWNYERNLAKEDPQRKDISYSVWGNSWGDSEDPGSAGIALDETFSYEVNVFEDTMHLTFTNARHETVKFSINLADNVDANGNVDEFDHAKGYAGDTVYFKAGAYNQCSVKDDPGFWYPNCLGTGDWKTDKENGDYAQVTFLRLQTGKGIKPE